MFASQDIRRQFIEFFEKKGHVYVPSSPVVPHDDPTLMFTNAGMNQFKPYFLGRKTPEHRRVANSQKCIRAGGKHNDLDDVGQDTYHHTFFEMLGNWSFGDYFKKEAIAWAWELLTGVWGIEKDRLHATFFEGDAAEGLEPDEEAAKLWRTVTDIKPQHIHPGNKKDNFWEMGDTGPCGPCSEIHIDLTPDKSGGSLVNAGDPRVMELWNLVFIQFNRGSDGKLSPLPEKHVDTGMGFERLCAVLNRKNSNYDTDVFRPLFDAIQKRCRASEYKGTLPAMATRDTTAPTRDVILPTRDRGGADDVDNRQAPPAEGQVMIDVAYRVIADHVRCLVFALTDGAYPSNEGRGYVLRRILRRAVRYGRQYFDMHEPFMCDLVPAIVGQMGDVFSELRTAHGGKNVERVVEVLRDEEASFLKTLDRGIRLANTMCLACRHTAAYGKSPTFNKRYLRAFIKTTYAKQSDVCVITSGDWDNLSPPHQAYEEILEMGRLGTLITDEVLDAIIEDPTVVPARVAFTLHDTYGFPIDLTELIAHEQDLWVDTEGYEQLMNQARSLARGGQVRNEHLSFFFEMVEHVRGKSQFVGYDSLDIETSITTLIVRDQHGEFAETDKLSIDQDAWVILRETPFYPERGGQIGDKGSILASDLSWEFAVVETLKASETILHRGHCVRGQLKIPLPSAGSTGGPSGAPCRAFVDGSHREPTMRNHTSTHVLNWALREVLGEHVQQKGSLVDPEKTRFDFSHPKPVSDDELNRIESLVNERIEAKLGVFTKNDCKLADAQKIKGLRAVFGEKYPDVVRVVSIGVPVEDLLADPDNDEWMKYSVEFCGGTHVKNMAEAERFVIVSEEAVAKGVRRVVGVTGDAARKAEEAGRRLLERADALRNAPAEEVAGGVAELQKELADSIVPVRESGRLRSVLGELQEIAKQHGKLQAGVAAADVLTAAANLLESAWAAGDTKIIVGAVPNGPADALRGAIDWFRQKTASSAVLLANHDGEKVTLIAGMTRDVVDRGVKAGDLIKEIAPLVGGRGGGRPDMAQGGGTDPTGVDRAVGRAREWLIERLS